MRLNFPPWYNMGKIRNEIPVILQHTIASRNAIVELVKNFLQLFSMYSLFLFTRLRVKRGGVVARGCR